MAWGFKLFILSYTLGTFISGGLRNYHSFKKILLFSNLIRIPLLILMIYSESLQFSLLLCFSCIFSGGLHSIKTCFNKCFCTKRKNKKANSLSSTTYAALHLICPYIGAIIYTRLGTITPIFLGDLLTYVVAFILLLGM